MKVKRMRISPTCGRSVVRQFAAFFIACCAITASAQALNGLQSLEAYVKTAKTGRADFTQVVTSPPKAGQAPRIKTSTGTFEFSRPERFKFVYKKPFEQTIVADGRTLWLHDVDLNQVTGRKQAQVLNASPAALVATATDLKSLQADFNLANAPDLDGQVWVLATPKSKDGQVQTVRIGFKGPNLATLEILDSFGQNSRMSFSAVQVNPVLDAATFQFKPPAGVDVVNQ
jgi:outer membrane lipoprotein carrier protein